MTLRLSLALLVSLAGAASAQPPAESASAGVPLDDTSTTIDAAAIDAVAADAVANAQAPPAPPLGPVQAYRPLNFYTREELRAFPAAGVPLIAPACGGAYVAPPLPPLDGDDRGLGAPVYVAADRMQLDENGESQVAGSVEVRQGQNMMRAERAVISAARDKLLLDGNVYLQDPSMTLEASRAELTLDGSGSHIRDTRYAVHASNIRGSADAINREDIYRVEIQGGAYTTCEPGNAAWLLAAHRIRLDQEAGWGSASHVRLQVQRVPVLYVPYITFPIDKRRRTGILYPTFNFSSESGTDISVPYYINLDPQYDLLLTPRWIEERGKAGSAQFRYLHGAPAASYGNGELGVGWIGRDALYNNDDRYAVRFRHSGAPADGWQLYADATEVSDNDYLDDIDAQISVNREAHLLRVAQVRHTADRWSALARVQAYQTIDPTIPLSDQPYRRLPQLQFVALQPVAGGLEWGGLAEYSLFDRDIDIADPHGARLRMEPVVRWPLARDSFRLVPTLKARHAGYDLEQNPTGDSLSRTIPTASLDGTLFLERSFRLHDRDWTQTLEPRFYALWTPYENQDDIPLFDTTAMTFSYDQLFRDNRFAGGDRIGDARQVSLALESRFIGPDGSESGRLGIGQTLFDADRRVQMSTLDPVETERYSPFVANALWRLSKRWSARAEGQWEPQDREFVRGSLRAGWQDEAFRTANLAYRYDNPGIDQAELSGLLPVDAAWSLVGRWVFDFETARSLEALGGIEYESCCWRARILARHTLDIETGSAALVPENSIIFELELKGLGSLGEKISAELAETIPGYENRKHALP
ncbi:MAG: LPS-assembly protein LptD [Pseudomonadota bacterium]